jgi:adenylate cyclase
MHTGLGPTQKDTFASPFWRRSNRQGGFAFERSRVFGVEVHATAAANLINQEWIRRADFGTEIFWLCLVVLSIAFVVSLLGPLYGCMSLVFLFVIWGFVAYELFLRRFFLPGVVSVIVLAVHYIFILVIYYLSSYRSQKNAIRALSMYVSPIVARKAVQNPKVLELGGKLTHATALFTDIADFTSISETMSAEAVSRMLNEYFTSVMEVVQKNSGTLNKFIGDAIFAIWGAPLEMEDHADKAVHTALAIERGVREFNALKRYPVLHTRIGVHTGDMIVGNLGTKSRLDFTAIGDSVNLASRLEGINKYFGTTIMISSTAVSEISTPFPLTRMGTVAVKGKEETISVYTIFDPPLSRAVEAGWREAQMEFQCRSWENAKTVFLKIASLEPRLEVATMLYLDNIKFYKEHPPLEKWNGAIIFGAK